MGGQGRGAEHALRLLTLAPPMARMAGILEDAITVEARALKKHGVEIPDDAGLASLLRAVYEKLTGEQAADPLAIVEDEVRPILDR